MLIDTSFDCRTDAGGKDPDSYSKTLCRYHERLWSKVLPNGKRFDLVASTDGAVYCLRHRSALGDFYLKSDCIIHTYRSWVRTQHIITALSRQEREEISSVGWIIGACLVFPGNPVNRKQTINGARGCNAKLADRFDLALECIRRHYIGQPSPLADTLERYGDFFSLFETFRGYVDYFLLQDLVVDDYSAVKFYLPFDGFRSSPVPGNVSTYRDYWRLTKQFLKARNRRIDRYAASLRSEAPQQIRLTTSTIDLPQQGEVDQKQIEHQQVVPQLPVAPAIPQVTLKMQQQVVELIGDHGVVWLENDKYCIGVPTGQYLKKDLTNWKKFISNGNVRWASNVNFEAALKYAGSPRSRAARASAAERKAAAEAVALS